MPDLKIVVGGRDYEVACQAGEERYLEYAARLLDDEATVLAGQIGRVPEPRMLLMSGLMLADKTAGLEEQLRGAEKQIAALEADLAQAAARAAPAAERVEVPVIPAAVIETMAELAARAEAIADEVEERAAG